MSVLRFGTVLLAGATLAFSSTAHAAGASRQEKIDALQQQINDLNAEVADLKRSTPDQYTDVVQKQGDKPDVAVSLKTMGEYSACRDKELSGAAYQKIMMQGFTGSATPSAAQVKKQMEKNSADAEVYIERKCGKDPSKYNKDDVYRKAEKDGAKAAGMDDKCYEELKERAYAFCQLSPAAQEAAKQNGIKVDVVGVPDDWVYTADEAKALAAKCPDLIKAIDGLNAQSPDRDKVKPSIRP